MSTTEPKKQLNTLPDLGDVIFIIVLQLILFTIPNMLLGDGSTGWHLVSGQYILQHHAIPYADLISYTKSGAPWVAYEWLSDALMAAVTSIAGLKALALFVGTLIALLMLLLYERCRDLGCHFFLATILTIMGAIVSSIHWLARPHIFTFFGVYIFSITLESFRRGRISNKKLLITLAVTMIFWVNLHPAFLLGFVLVAIYLFADLVIFSVCAPGDSRSMVKKRASVMACAVVLLLIASLVNPYGYGLYTYILHYFSGSKIIAVTDEFSSPVFHGGVQSICLELLIFLLMIGLAFSKKRPALAQLLSVLFFTALALASVRNMPVFVIVALPFIAELLAHVGEVGKIGDGESTNLKTALWWQKLSQWWLRFGKVFDEIEPLSKMHILPVIFVAILAASLFNDGKLFGVTILSSGFDAKRMPTKTLEYIAEHKLPANRGFNSDNWGGYIKYKTGMPVFIDDRADFYGEKFYYDYGKVFTVSPGWTEVLNRYHIQWILFPKDSQLAARLSESPDWTLVCEDRAAKLFVRH